MYCSQRQQVHAAHGSFRAAPGGRLGKLYRRSGRPDPARDHVAAAATMYREMDMRFWPEQADAELAALS